MKNTIPNKIGKNITLTFIYRMITTVPALSLPAIKMKFYTTIWVYGMLVGRIRNDRPCK